MKKLITILLAFCLLVGLCACGGNPEDNDNTEATQVDTLYPDFVAKSSHNEKMMEHL